MELYRPFMAMPSASNDLQVGGKYTARMEAKDGNFGFDLGGTYTEFIDGKKLTFKLDDGRDVTASFTANGNVTHVSVVFDAEDISPVEMQKGGWQLYSTTLKSIPKETNDHLQRWRNI
ncbi:MULTISPECIES: SRPBCC domain-containing protein [unclassified Mucilaginibacter]|uniref:SRPBCC domain-containing protein n=1 Tax=unclassified Mucilaginibacter TaxID=2617802 RepID=UPI002AC8F149|nr:MULTISPECIES: SRPBCC domain-containing protein [unclassified Mucilaginibacter]MEB0264062.1 SRPBCC domain-containing protein [Mucilaginibacter sp. 10I4]MEB0280881.1 SRPBCC domain-containing protein [Mucilaginibacter sp. 10B2]MEB0303165.1 SRPBCC domain-containing protein [Mucilaginibacter sp. 5C4]WPX23573.1 SRPBCC domain-containing protein [Mucilaginibacter sp. 5C4]